MATAVSVPRIAGYRLTGEVRAGGSAEVFAASDAQGRLVAIKLARAGAEAALLREAEAMAALDAVDPSTSGQLPLLARGEAEGRPWLAMPWVADSMRSWIERESPAPAAVAVVLVQAGRAVESFREVRARLGLVPVHGDLKPDNVLIGDGRVWLADLGGAVGGECRFTPRYSPVEAAIGHGERQPAEDAFALAVTVYWALTGREPDARSQAIPWTADGQRLLASQAAVRNEDEPEHAALLGRPLADLVVLEEVAALLIADEQRLRALLDDELRAVGSDQSTESLAEPLIRSLRRAMDPDPERRDAELGGMIEACQRVAVALGSAAVEPAPASPAVNAPAPPPQLPVSTEPPASPTPEGPVDLEARDPAGVLFLGSVALLTVAVAAWALFWRR